MTITTCEPILLDWMRGLAVVIMMQCHTFNSFARLDVRQGGPYVLSQFVGGMAAPLFIFMAGMTFGFQMECLERREPNPWRRYLVARKRAGYIVAIAFAFRLSNRVASLPRPDWQEIFKVDILNSMALGVAAFAVIAALGAQNRSPARCGSFAGPCRRQPELERRPANRAGLSPLAKPAAGSRSSRMSRMSASGLAAGAVVKRTAADGLKWGKLVEHVSYTRF
jgi:Heparan-alpha-glucosaminide N-acetyltransferase, catalytic